MSAGGMEQDVYGSDEMSMRDYWALARRRKWYIILPVLVAVGASLAVSLSTTPMYRSKAEVLVEVAPVPGQVSTETAMNDATLQNELSRAQRVALQEQARQEVGQEPKLKVMLDDAQESDLFVFTAESRSSRRAADAANAYANTYVESRKAELVGRFEQDAQVRQQQVDDARARLRELTDANTDEAAELRLQIADLRGQIDALETAARSAEATGATVINVAEVAERPFAPRTERSAVLSLLLGLFVGLAAAFLRDFTDNHIRTPERLEQATGLPTTAVIPRLKGWKKSETHVVVLEDPASPQAESYRALRARIQFRRVDRPIRSMVVTSPRPGEGKTTTSTNLAVAFATAGENTVLVDLDMRRPRVHKFFPLKNDHGMSTVLAGGELNTAIRQIHTVPNLSVVPAGPPTIDQSELLREDRLTAVLNALKSRFDVVIIDTPPVLAVADPLTIAHHCDGTIVVVSASGTDSRDAELAVQQLAQVGVPPIGAILNNYSASETGYAYSYAYSDYSPTEKGRSKKERSGEAAPTHTSAVPLIQSTATVSQPSSATSLGELASEAPQAPKLSRRQLRKLSKNSKKAAKKQQTSFADVTTVDGPPVPTIHSTQAVEVVPEYPTQPAAQPIPPAPTPSQPTSPQPAPVADIQPAAVPEPVVPDPQVLPASLGEGAAAAQAAPTPQPSVAPTSADALSEAPEDSTRQVASPETGVVQAIDDHVTVAPVSDIDVVDVLTEVEVKEYLRSELRQAREEHVPAQPPLADAIGLEDLPDESTERLNRPVTEEIDSLTGNGASTNGDGHSGDDEETEVMSADEFQEYLRSELRRAREEHAASGSDGPVQTIKVVLVADDEAAADSANEPTSKKSTAKKSTAKRSKAKKSTAKKSTAKKSTAKKSTAEKNASESTDGSETVSGDSSKESED